MITHNIRFHGEIKKKYLSGYPLFAYIPGLFYFLWPHSFTPVKLLNTSAFDT